MPVTRTEKGQGWGPLAGSELRVTPVTSTLCPGGRGDQLGREESVRSWSWGQDTRGARPAPCTQKRTLMNARPSLTPSCRPPQANQPSPCSSASPWAFPGCPHSSHHSLCCVSAVPGFVTPTPRDARPPDPGSLGLAQAPPATSLPCPRHSGQAADTEPQVGQYLRSLCSPKGDIFTQSGGAQRHCIAQVSPERLILLPRLGLKAGATTFLSR